MAEKTKAELEAEIAALKEKLDKENKADDKVDDAKLKAFLEEEVPIQLFKDGDKYKDDLVICLNGKIVRFKRGIPLMVKRKYALLIDNCDAQGIIAAETINEAERGVENKPELND